MLISLFLVGLSALEAYFGRPTTEAEIRREVDRLHGHRSKVRRPPRGRPHHHPR